MMVLFGQSLGKLFSLGNGSNLNFIAYLADGQSSGKPAGVSRSAIKADPSTPNTKRMSTFHF